MSTAGGEGLPMVVANDAGESENHDMPALARSVPF